MLALPAKLSEGFGRFGLFFRLLPCLGSFFQGLHGGLSLLQCGLGCRGAGGQGAAQIGFLGAADDRAVGVIDQQLFLVIAAQLAD